MLGTMIATISRMVGTKKKAEKKTENRLFSRVSIETKKTEVIMSARSILILGGIVAVVAIIICSKIVSLVNSVGM
jgi:hypothetical protein